jgi:uncharacterized protein
MPSTRTILIATACLLALGAVAAGVTGCTTVQIQEKDVFLPKPSITPASFDVAGVTLDNRFVRSDSVRLNVWHLKREDAKGTVLFFGGNGFYLVQSRGYVEALTHFPVNVVMFDYRGYGNSGGEPGVGSLKQDALRVYDYTLDSLGADPDHLIVHGHSLGTFMASHTASNRPVSGVVLENPATDVEGWIDGLAPWFVRLFVDFEVDPSLRGESNVKPLQSITTPILVVGGENDNITRPEMAQELVDEAVSPEVELLIVEGGTHNYLYRDSTYTAAYGRLIEKTLGRRGGLTTSAAEVRP